MGIMVPMELWMLLLAMNEKMWSRRYAAEREYPEWFDHGGEA